MEKVAVITGSSKGLGKSLVEKFKKEGFKIIGISRSKNYSQVDIFIEADLTDKKQFKDAVEKIFKNTEKLDLLINNAGIGLYDKWKDATEEEIRKLFELNFFVPVFLTKELLPLLKKVRGTVINVSSVAGKLPIPYMGAYCASKYALNAFSDTLRAELKEENIKVLNLIVGRINTGFSTRALGSKKPPETPSFDVSPEEFADSVFKAYKRGKREIIFPSWYRFFIYLSKLFPETFEKIALSKWKDQSSNFSR